MGIAGLLQRGEEASAGPALPTLLGCGSERTEHKGKCRTEKPPADHSGGGGAPVWLLTVQRRCRWAWPPSGCSEHCAPAGGAT